MEWYVGIVLGAVFAVVLVSGAASVYSRLVERWLK